MYPEIKKFSLLKDSPASIATDHTTDGGSEVLLSDNTSPNTPAGINYMHVIQTWECSDCKYKGEDGTFIRREENIVRTENSYSSTTVHYCPKCDSRNIKFPEPPQYGVYGHNGEKIK